MELSLTRVFRECSANDIRKEGIKRNRSFPTQIFTPSNPTQKDLMKRLKEKWNSLTRAFHDCSNHESKNDIRKEGIKRNRSFYTQIRA